MAKVQYIFNGEIVTILGRYSDLKRLWIKLLSKKVNATLFKYGAVAYGN